MTGVVDRIPKSVSLPPFELTGEMEPRLLMTASLIDPDSFLEIASIKSVPCLLKDDYGCCVVVYSVVIFCVTLSAAALLGLGTKVVFATSLVLV